MESTDMTDLQEALNWFRGYTWGSKPVNDGGKTKAAMDKYRDILIQAADRSDRLDVAVEALRRIHQPSVDGKCQAMIAIEALAKLEAENGQQS